MTVLVDIEYSGPRWTPHIASIATFWCPPSDPDRMGPRFLVVSGTTLTRPNAHSHRATASPLYGVRMWPCAMRREIR